MGKYINFNDLADQVAFKEVLDWLKIPYSEQDGKLIGKGFSVDIKANRYKASADNYGNIINFVNQVKKCGLRRAAEMIDEEFPSEEKAPVNTVLDSSDDDKNGSQRQTRKRELLVIDEQGVLIGKLVLEQHA